MLALNHVSTRHPLGMLRATRPAPCSRHRDPARLDTIEIPFAERGEPTLVRGTTNRRRPRRLPRRPRGGPATPAAP